MLAGLEQGSGNDSESGARKAALGNASRGMRRVRWLSLPHKRAIFRYDPPIFD
jgi:hypothetical protein